MPQRDIVLNEDWGELLPFQHLVPIGEFEVDGEALEAGLFGECGVILVVENVVESEDGKSFDVEPELTLSAVDEFVVHLKDLVECITVPLLGLFDHELFEDEVGHLVLLPLLLDILVELFPNLLDLSGFTRGLISWTVSVPSLSLHILVL